LRILSRLTSRNQQPSHSAAPELTATPFCSCRRQRTWPHQALPECAYAGQHPPASLELKEVAYLIATAPLTDKVRAAAWQVMASLPGLSICHDLPGQADPGTVDLCIGSSGDQTLLNVDTSTGAIITIADRLRQASPAYPRVTGGTIVGSSTFVSG
jgi:hypothetical protein